MNRERTIDIETRFQRWLEWRRSHVLTLRAWWKDAIGRFRQGDWSETQAQVVSCTPVRSTYYGTSRDGWAPTGGWAVNFAYTAAGKKFEGIFNSRNEVEMGDTFAIRYNPANPEENNTLDSELGWFNGYVLGLYDLFLVLLIASLAIAGLMMRR